ncbi:MAG: SPOR domain-containing protein [Candidatus Omnitrophica bacterium]|nr:SPOR domain-containing protein [Candidatus Omnitrophota bacterium]
MTPMWAKKQTAPIETISEKEAQYRLYGDIGLNILSDAGAKPHHREKHKKNKLEIEIESLSRELEKTKKKIYHRRHIKIDRVVKVLFVAAGLVLVVSVFGSRLINNIKRIPQATPAAAYSKQASGVSYAIQAATYNNEKDAQSFAQILSSVGYPAFINPSHSRNKIMYRVCVGPLKDKKETEALLFKLRKEKGASDSFVVKLNEPQYK